MPLIASKLRSLPPGRYGDGDNLYLQVKPPNRRSWLFRYRLAGKSHGMGLGAYPEVSLAKARDAARACLDLLRNGIDPLGHRAMTRVETDKQAVTLGIATERCIAALSGGWREDHTRAWRNSLLRDHVPQRLLRLPVSAIGTEALLDILRPLWTAKNPTATVLRSRIEAVLDHAIAKGWRDGPNPAIWRGNLRSLLPLPSKVHRPRRRVALDWRTVPEVFQRIVANGAVGYQALAFIMLTAVRADEALSATWSEIDLDNALWTINAERMKGGRAHRVPLADPALSILRYLRPLRRPTDDLVFPGQTMGRPLSLTTVRLELRAMAKSEDADTHGLRSTFRDWSAEVTHYPNMVAEQALAHAIGDDVEAAYRRGDLLDKRRGLMADWATYLTKPAGEVIEPAQWRMSA
jgi:integrase